MTERAEYDYKRKEYSNNPYCSFCGTTDSFWHTCIKCGARIHVRECEENLGLCQKCFEEEQ
jgi:acetyl-CoA carboxylase beta subunit